MSSPDTLAPVERLYARLIDALHRSRPDPFAAPVTVAEIYQELVPYRVVRAEIGFDMNADYEHALLRLLSGEAGRVRLEPKEAAETIQRELRTSNPNLSMYREYAGCDVWVRPATPVPHDAGSGEPPARNGSDMEKSGDERPLAAFATFAVSTEARAGGATRAPASPPESRPPAPPASSSPTAPVSASPVEPEPWSPPDDDDEATVAGPVPEVATVEPGAGGNRLTAEPIEAMEEEATAGRCAFCEMQLPAGRAVRFCPYCGTNQTKRSCAECGDVVEGGWAYCVACGASAQ